MTKAEIRAEFLRLYNSLPGKHKDRIKCICGVLGCKPNTVRIWTSVTAEPKEIPLAKLRILQLTMHQNNHQPKGMEV